MPRKRPAKRRPPRPRSRPRPPRSAPSWWPPPWPPSWWPRTWRPAWWPARLWPRRLPRLPLGAWVVVGLAVLAGMDACYQLVKKPTEILGLVAPTAPKLPQETWREYGSLFEEHATSAIPPELLAALVQAESSGDPLARTYWRFKWNTNPLELYGPASSAVGLLQMTDSNYAEARRLCVHDHHVAREGAWYDPRACFLNALYLRTVPGDAIEMTAAFLQVTTDEILARPGLRRPSPAEVQQLAAVVHLCGKERGARFAARGFRPMRGERCGDHDVAGYLGRVRMLLAVFAAQRG